MLSSKYIFETKETRTWRYFKNGLLYLFTLVFLYILCGYFFILIADNENGESKEKFFKNPPDLIVIFTGDSGRIPYGIKLAKDFNQSNIFITGVYNKNSVETLIDPLQIDDEINPNLLEIDYFARNTVENVLSTLRFLRQKKGFNNILVVSHDYHIPRIKAIFGHTRTDNDKYSIYYTGLKSDYSELRNLKVLYKEVYKFIRTYAFLMIWDTDVDDLPPSHIDN